MFQLGQEEIIFIRFEVYASRLGDVKFHLDWLDL